MRLPGGVQWSSGCIFIILLVDTNLLKTTLSISVTIFKKLRPVFFRNESSSRRDLETTLFLNKIFDLKIDIY